MIRPSATRMSQPLSLLLLILVGANLAEAQIVPNPAHNWDASTDTNGNTTWEDTGTQADRPWTLAGPLGAHATGPSRVAVSGLTTISHAYDFDGVDDNGSASSENRSGNHNTSFELWLKPREFPVTTAGTARVIFEHGNGPRGVSFGIAGSNLLFAYTASPDLGLISYNLDLGGNGIDNTDFIQVVGVIDDTNNQLRLYVDGANERLLSILRTRLFPVSQT